MLNKLIFINPFGTIYFMKIHKNFFIGLLFIFSININATLDTRTWCDGRIIHWNLYQVTFEPFSDSSSIGMLEFWMGFKKNGGMIPKIFMWSWDKFVSDDDITLYTSSERTYLELITNKSENSRGCYAVTRIEGVSNTGPYSFTILGSGFISRGNADLNSDADYFTLNNALINYGGIEKWGKLTFTQIR